MNVRTFIEEQKNKDNYLKDCNLYKDIALCAKKINCESLQEFQESFDRCYSDPDLTVVSLDNPLRLQVGFLICENIDKPNLDQKVEWYLLSFSNLI